jgi:Tfp pilus assembly protein PilE
MKNKEQKNGITLIALIITIIVLLILARNNNIGVIRR